MSQSPYIERYGNLLKLETLQLLEDKILPNTFVLEAPEPFPGYFDYYSEYPKDSKPLYIYFVVRKLYTLEEVTRATQNIKQYFEHKFDAAAGVVNIYNKEFNVIRVRHLPEFEQVAELQSCYMDEGIEFKKKPGGKLFGPAIIRMKKFYILEEKHPGIFLDVAEKDHGYINIPKQIGWKHFEDLTKKVKFNWTKSTFDAALGHFHINSGIQDMIRIYSHELNLEDLFEIQKLYFDRIK